MCIKFSSEIYLPVHTFIQRYSIKLVPFFHRTFSNETRLGTFIIMLLSTTRFHGRNVRIRRGHRGAATKPRRRSDYGIAAVESHTGRIEIIPPIFVVSFTLFSPLNINGHMLSGVMAQEVTTAYNTRVLTLFYCLQISSIVFSYTSILSRILPFAPLLAPRHPPVPLPHLLLHRCAPRLSFRFPLYHRLSLSLSFSRRRVLSASLRPSTSILLFLPVAPRLCLIPIFSLSPTPSLPSVAHFSPRAPMHTSALCTS